PISGSNGGTVTPDEFGRHDISRPTHPDYPALLDVFAQSELQDDYVGYWGMALVMAAARPHNSTTRSKRWQTRKKS
ncbi:MAG: hypothetical protein AAFY56_24480, partial [Pseudomonadota bacterium]